MNESGCFQRLTGCGTGQKARDEVPRPFTRSLTPTTEVLHQRDDGLRRLACAHGWLTRRFERFFLFGAFDLRLRLVFSFTAFQDFIPRRRGHRLGRGSWNRSGEFARRSLVREVRQRVCGCPVRKARLFGLGRDGVRRRLQDVSRRRGFNFLNARQAFGQGWRRSRLLRFWLLFGRIRLGWRSPFEEIHRAHAFSGLNQHRVQIFARERGETAAHRIERGGLGIFQRRDPCVWHAPAEKQQVARAEVGLRVMDVDGLARAQPLARNRRLEKVTRPCLPKPIGVHRSVERKDALGFAHRRKRQPRQRVLTPRARGHVAFEQRPVDEIGGGARRAGDGARGLVIDTGRRLPPVFYIRLR
ncbi:MAG: hypothetical protein HND47_23680 [Chloroflexi bacterium]|nr:hypothetical protein [Chloroflexota bacterium]